MLCNIWLKITKKSNIKNVKHCMRCSHIYNTVFLSLDCKLQCLTFRQGLEDTSNEALKARLCCVVRMVRGRLGLLGSFASSPLPGPPEHFSGLISSSSSSLFSGERSIIHRNQHISLQFFRQAIDE